MEAPDGAPTKLKVSVLAGKSGSVAPTVNFNVDNLSTVLFSTVPSNGASFSADTSMFISTETWLNGVVLPVPITSMFAVPPLVRPVPVLSQAWKVTAADWALLNDNVGLNLRRVFASA